MAFFTIPHVAFEGIVSCVPKSKHLVSDCLCLSKEEATKLTATTGIRERRIVEDGICTSDLCFEAASVLIEKLGWQKDEIDAVVFVTQTPDYILPATSPLLQDRLGLKPHCFTLDISLGCSGYVYGLTTLSSLMSTGGIKKALLLVGDTVSKICSPMDKTTYPLFGDAGTATALVYDQEASPMYANMKSDGRGYKSIMIHEGASRAPYNELSSHTVEVSTGVMRSKTQLVLEGMDVFSFGITKAPEVTRELFQHINLPVEQADYFVFHQANMMMNEKIRKKLNLPVEKVPYTLEQFGNTSCATIPLTMTVNLSETLRANRNKLLLCGFGVGLSWGAVLVDLPPLKTVELIEI